MKGNDLGTKENIEYIKEELSNEEKFLESVIKAEKFFKRYKKPLLALGVVLVLAIVGYSGYEFKKEHDVKEANEALTRLLVNPLDKQAFETLRQKSPKLFRLYRYKVAVENKDLKTLAALASSNDPILSDLARYHLALLKRNDHDLGTYAGEKEAILRDLALLDEAYLLYGKEETSKAHKELSKIDTKSPAAPYALLLGHYGVK